LLSLADLCPTGRAAELSNSGLRRLSEILAAVPLTIDATEGWDKAMVTRGGVRLKEVEPKTLASRRAEGLWLAGEMLDLDGPCGGYNLTWALASGYLAGRSAADACAP
jgi:predicted flavoprotein YhiN